MDDVVNGDPVRARRARIARIATIGKRIGYAALLVAILAFFVGVLLDFPEWCQFLIIAGLIGACIVLPIPIVLGYGVRAAEREDGHRTDKE
jgi:hypothetical protein